MRAMAGDVLVDAGCGGLWKVIAAALGQFHPERLDVAAALRDDPGEKLARALETAPRPWRANPHQAH